MFALSLVVSIITGSPGMGTFLLISGPAMSLVAFLRYRQQKQEVESERERILAAYDNRLNQVLEIAASFHSQQMEALAWRYPSPGDFQSWVRERNHRLWERRPGEPDFLDLRLGTWRSAPSYTLRLPAIDIPDLAPEPLLRAHQRAAPYQWLEAAPFGWNLDQQGSLAIVGELALRQAFARALVAQITTLHAPEDLQLWALFPPSQVDRWAWLKWLPHTAVLQSGDNIHHLAYQPEDLRRLCSALMDEMEARRLRVESGLQLEEPTLILLVTDPTLLTGEPLLDKLVQHQDLKIKLILLAPHASSLPNGLRGWIDIQSREQATLIEGPESTTATFVPDGLDWKSSDDLARKLAPLRLVDDAGGEPLPDEIQLLDLIDPPSLERLDLAQRWLESLRHPPQLKTPLGMRTGNRPLVIDLKQSGHGPHGLIAGTTGSGKSELLLTLLCGLAINHHPHQVNFVLVDYKGGTALSALADLPHTVGLVTDLDGKQTRRALKALRSEMSRREEILARHQVADIDKYYQRNFEEPFPYLFIVIDEFAELRQHFSNDLSNILGEFVSIAQKGRALGVHLILAMQKPEGIVSDSIRANMKFRMCLRVERTEDSRNVLGRNDAYLLPNQPVGRAYFQVGNQQFDLFQVARIAGRQTKDSPFSMSGNACIYEVGHDGSRCCLKKITNTEDKDANDGAGETSTQAQTLVEMARQAGESLEIERLPSPWPPPLPDTITLDKLFARQPQPGWDGRGWAGLGPTTEANLRPVPIALLDDPENQNQSPLQLELDKLNSLILIGSPGSGKTMSLLSMLTSLARRHRPSELHFHILAFGGHQFHSCASEFPHVAGVYSANDSDQILRLQTQLIKELEDRRRAFAHINAADLKSYRSLSADADQPAIIIIIDNLSGFLEHIGDRQDGWKKILREGSSYGLYFLLSSDRLPPNHLADLIKGRIALMLADSTWYSVILGGRPDLLSYDPQPGRGYFAGKPPSTIQLALTYQGKPEQILSRIRDLGNQMKRTWQGPTPEPIRVLPDQVELCELLTCREDMTHHSVGLQATIGLEGETLHSLAFDLSRYGSTFLVSGPPESGKTTSLISITLSIAHHYSPDAVNLILVASNRSQAYLWEALSGLPHCQALLRTESDFIQWVDELEMTDDDLPTTPKPTLMILDDQPMWANRVSSRAVSRLEAVVRRGEVLGLTVAASLPLSGLNLLDGVVRALKTGRVGLWLKPTDAGEALAVGLRLPRITTTTHFPVGRGYLYQPAEHHLVQVASPYHRMIRNTETQIDELNDWVNDLQARWIGRPNTSKQVFSSNTGGRRRSFQVNTDMAQEQAREA